MSDLTIRPRPLFALFAPIKYLFFGMLLLIAAIILKPYVPMEYLRYGIAVVFGIMFLGYLISYLYIRSVKYTITDERIIFTRGIFTITTDYIELYRVQDFTVVRSFLLRFIGGMSFRMDTLDKSHPVFILKGIPKSNVDTYIRELVEKARLKKRVFITE